MKYSDKQFTIEELMKSTDIGVHCPAEAIYDRLCDYFKDSTKKGCWTTYKHNTYFRNSKTGTSYGNIAGDSVNEWLNHLITINQIIDFNNQINENYDIF